MNSVKEIESTTGRLPASELPELTRCFDEHVERNWDEQMKADAEAGLLDALVNEAREARRKGQTTSFR
jgi:hypothetical protein